MESEGGVRDIITSLMCSWIVCKRNVLRSQTEIGSVFYENLFEEQLHERVRVHSLEGLAQLHLQFMGQTDLQSIGDVREWILLQQRYTIYGSYTK